MTVADDIAAGRLRWASEPRLGSNINEDRVGISQNAVWVLDGAGTPAGVESCCDKDAAWYIERLDAALSAKLQDDEDVPLADALAAAIADVQTQHAANCPEPASGRGPSSTVAIARRSDDWLDLLVLGDSTVLLDDGIYVTAIRDTRLAELAPELRRDIKTAIASGHGYRDAEHDRRRAELVNTERLHRNRDDGYWIAADNPLAARRAITARYPVALAPSNVRRLALLTDGAQRATSMFALYDSDRVLLDAAGAGGPGVCIAQVRAAEAHDPDGQRHPRTKRSDDATLLLWDIVPNS